LSSRESLLFGSGASCEHYESNMMNFGEMNPARNSCR